MSSTTDERLVKAEEMENELHTTPRLSRWARFGLLAGGAAVAIVPVAGTAFADHSPQTPGSPMTVSPATISPATGTVTVQTISPATVSPQTLTTATVSPNTLSPNTAGTGTTLQLATLFHDGITPAQAAAIATALRMSPAEVQGLSLGQLLHAAKHAGYTTQDVAAWLSS